MAQTRFRAMTDGELLVEAERRMAAPNDSDIRVGGRDRGIAIGAVAAGAVLYPLAGLIPFALAVGVGGYYLFCSQGRFKRHREYTGIAAGKMRGTLIGRCPACEREITLTPQGTTFTLHCPLCHVPIKYDRGVCWAEPR